MPTPTLSADESLNIDRSNLRSEELLMGIVSSYMKLTLIVPSSAACSNGFNSSTLCDHITTLFYAAHRHCMLWCRGLPTGFRLERFGFDSDYNDYCLNVEVNWRPARLCGAYRHKFTPASFQLKTKHYYNSQLKLGDIFWSATGKPILASRNSLLV